MAKGASIDQELTPWVLRYGYSQGIFPMTTEDGSVGWFEPIVRAIFPLEGVHVSGSLAKTIRSGRFEVRFDSAFEAVMRGCLRPGDNWISEHFIQVYTQVHREGWAHSVETWREGRLVGGLYGIALGSVFCAESMFHRETDASKVALWAAVEKCRELGFTIFDAQVMNPHLKRMGAVGMKQAAYLKLLAKALRSRTPWSIY